ncbi:MAG: hypothetical protein QXX84_01945 [Sulfolobales archaeon]
MPPPISRPLDVRMILLSVRKAIRDYFGRDPGEAGVVFVKAGRGVLGYVELGSRIIKINADAYRSFIDAEGVDASTEYLFVVMLHEYLHIMGILDEREVRRISMDIVERVFGKGSRASRIAEMLADPRDLILRRLGKTPSPYI